MDKLSNELSNQYVIINGTKICNTDLYIVGNENVITTNSILYIFESLLIDNLIKCTRIEILEHDIIFNTHYYDFDTIEIYKILSIVNNCVKIKNASSIINKICKNKDKLKLKCILDCKDIERRYKNDIFKLFISNSNKFKNKNCIVKLDDNYGE